jgi:hypothetical protein
MLATIRTHRLQLTRPPKTAKEYLETLAQNHLTQTVEKDEAILPFLSAFRVVFGPALVTTSVPIPRDLAGTKPFSET